MTSFQKNLLQCIKMIVAEAKRNPQCLEMIPKFKQAIEKMEALIAEIEALQVKQEQDKTGITADTNKIILQLKDYLVDISGALQIYATENNNNSQLERINFSEGSIYHLGKKDIVSVSTLITGEAGKLTTEELTALGISAEDLAECVRLQEVVRLKGLAPKHAIIEGAGYTEQLATKTNDAYKLKKETLDKLATQFKRKAPEFYHLYDAVSSMSLRHASRKNGNEEEVATETTDETTE